MVDFRMNSKNFAWILMFFVLIAGASAADNLTSIPEDSITNSTYWVDWVGAASINPYAGDDVWTLTKTTTGAAQNGVLIDGSGLDFNIDCNSGKVINDYLINNQKIKYGTDFNITHTLVVSNGGSHMLAMILVQNLTDTNAANDGACDSSYDLCNKRWVTVVSNSSRLRSTTGFSDKNTYVRTNITPEFTLTTGNHKFSQVVIDNTLYIYYDDVLSATADGFWTAYDPGQDLNYYYLVKHTGTNALSLYNKNISVIQTPWYVNYNHFSDDTYSGNSIVNYTKQLVVNRFQALKQGYITINYSYPYSMNYSGGNLFAGFNGNDTTQSNFSKFHMRNGTISGASCSVTQSIVNDGHAYWRSSCGNVNANGEAQQHIWINTTMNENDTMTISMPQMTCSGDVGDNGWCQIQTYFANGSDPETWSGSESLYYIWFGDKAWRAGSNQANVNWTIFTNQTGQVNLINADTGAFIGGTSASWDKFDNGYTIGWYLRGARETDSNWRSGTATLQVDEIWKNDIKLDPNYVGLVVNDRSVYNTVVPGDNKYIDIYEDLYQEVLDCDDVSGDNCTIDFNFVSNNPLTNISFSSMSIVGPLRENTSINVTTPTDHFDADRLLNADTNNVEFVINSSDKTSNITEINLTIINSTGGVVNQTSWIVNAYDTIVDTIIYVTDGIYTLILEAWNSIGGYSSNIYTLDVDTLIYIDTGILYDNFSDGILNTNKWQNGTTYSDSIDTKATGATRTYRELPDEMHSRVFAPQNTIGMMWFETTNLTVDFEHKVENITIQMGKMWINASRNSLSIAKIGVALAPRDGINFTGYSSATCAPVNNATIDGNGLDLFSDMNYLSSADPTSEYENATFTLFKNKTNSDYLVVTMNSTPDNTTYPPIPAHTVIRNVNLQDIYDGDEFDYDYNNLTLVFYSYSCGGNGGAGYTASSNITVKSVSYEPKGIQITDFGDLQSNLIYYPSNDTFTIDVYSYVNESTTTCNLYSRGILAESDARTFGPGSQSFTFNNPAFQEGVSTLELNCSNEFASSPTYNFTSVLYDAYYKSKLNKVYMLNKSNNIYNVPNPLYNFTDGYQKLDMYNGTSSCSAGSGSSCTASTWFWANMTNYNYSTQPLNFKNISTGAGSSDGSSGAIAFYLKFFDFDDPDGSTQTTMYSEWYYTHGYRGSVSHYRQNELITIAEYNNSMYIYHDGALENITGTVNPYTSTSIGVYTMGTRSGTGAGGASSKLEFISPAETLENMTWWNITPVNSTQILGNVQDFSIMVNSTVTGNVTMYYTGDRDAGNYHSKFATFEEGLNSQVNFTVDFESNDRYTYYFDVRNYEFNQITPANQIYVNGEHSYNPSIPYYKSVRGNETYVNLDIYADEVMLLTINLNNSADHPKNTSIFYFIDEMDSTASNYDNGADYSLVDIGAPFGNVIRGNSAGGAWAAPAAGDNVSLDESNGTWIADVAWRKLGASNNHIGRGFWTLRTHSTSSTTLPENATGLQIGYTGYDGRPVMYYQNSGSPSFEYQVIDETATTYNNTWLYYNLRSTNHSRNVSIYDYTGARKGNFIAETGNQSGLTLRDFYPQLYTQSSASEFDYIRVYTGAPSGKEPTVEIVSQTADQVVVQINGTDEDLKDHTIFLGSIDIDDSYGYSNYSFELYTYFEHDPNISILNPLTDDGYIPNASIDIVFNATDPTTNISNISGYILNSTRDTWTTFFWEIGDTLASIVNQTVNFIDGFYEIFVDTFTVDEHNGTTYRNFTVDTIDPTMEFISPTTAAGILDANEIIANISSIDVNSNYTTIYLYKNQTLYNTTGNEYFNFSDLADDYYWMNATSQDLASNLNFTETRNYLIDLTVPQVGEIHPNVSQEDLDVTYNVDVTDLALASCNLEVESIGTYPMTYASGNASYMINLPAGLYNFTPICTDDSGNVNGTETVVINVSDIRAPRITNMYPDGITYDVNDIINISANVTDENGVDVVYVTLTLPDLTTQVLGMTNTTEEEYNTSSYTIPYMIGLYSLDFYANDSRGNINNTVTSNFTARDLNIPSIEFEYPSTTVTNSDPFIQANITAYDDVEIDTIMILLYNTSNLTTPEISVSNSSGDSNFFHNFTDVSDGTYVLVGMVNDTSGNINSTTSGVAIDANPASNNLLTPPNLTITSNLSMNFSFSSVSNVNISNATLTILNSTGGIYNVTVFNVTNTTSIVFSTIVDFFTGIYTWFTSVIDVVGNINISDTFVLVVDNGTASFTTNFTTNYTYGQNLTGTFNFSNPLTYVGGYVLIINDNVVIVNETGSLPEEQYNISYNTTEIGVNWHNLTTIVYTPDYLSEYSERTSYAIYSTPSIVAVVPANDTQYSAILNTFNVTYNSSFIDMNCTLDLNSIEYSTTLVDHNDVNTTHSISGVLMEEGFNNFNFTCSNPAGTDTSEGFIIYSDANAPNINTTTFLGADKPLFMNENITGQWNMSDEVILYSYNFSVDGEQIKYNNTINDNNISVQLDYPTNNFSIGSHILTARVADGHTANELKNNYSYDVGSLFDEGLEFTIDELGSSESRVMKIKNLDGSMSDDFEVYEKEDRYEFEYIPASMRDTMEFQVTSSDELFVLKVPGSKYQEWIVSGNNWLDFVLEDYPYQVIEVDKTSKNTAHVKISLFGNGDNDDNKKDKSNNGNHYGQYKNKHEYNGDSFKFKSIGELNVAYFNYTFYKYNVTIDDANTLLNGAPYSSTITFNKGNNSWSVGNVNRSFNDTYLNIVAGNLTLNNTLTPYYEIWNATYIAPVVEGDVGVNFTTNFAWTINNYNYTYNLSQIVIPLNIGLCTNDTWAKAINFLLKDESISTNDSKAFVNSTVNIFLAVSPQGAEGGATTNLSLRLEGAYNYSICISPNSSVAVGNSILEYYADGYSNRKYYLLDLVLTNVTQTVDLYLVNASEASVIQMKVYDLSQGSPVPGAYIQVLRYYPELGAYRIVEIEKTDETGYALGKMIPNDIFYKFVVIYNNEVKLNTEVQTIYTSLKLLPISLSEDALQSFQYVGAIAQNTTCNLATQTCAFQWSDLNGLTETAHFKVYKINGWGKRIIHESSLSATAGVLIYTVTENISGNQYEAIGYIDTNTVNSLYIMSKATMEEATNFALWGGVESVIFTLMIITIALSFVLIDLGPAGVITGSLLSLLFGNIMRLIPLTLSAIVSLIIIGGLIISKSRA